MIDIVFPNGNEKAFVAMAKKLGYTGILFLYDEKADADFKSSFPVFKGVFANVRTIQRKIHQYRSKEIFVAISKTDDYRAIVDNHYADIIFDIELGRKKDFVHHRASGLNHIMAKKMKENNMVLGFSVSTLLSVPNRSQLLGRMMQNVALCKKYNVKMHAASFATKPEDMRSPNDIMSLFGLLGLAKSDIKQLDL